MDEQLKRLEAVTNRLESVVGHLSVANAQSQSTAHADSDSDAARLPILRDYETFVNDSVKPFLNVSQKNGDE